MSAKRILILLCLTVILIPALVSAQGRIIPPPRIVPPERIDPFTVKSMYVDVDIDRQVASTTIEQVFHNEINRVLEGTYLFPIPENASISKFTMWMNGEEVEGEVVEAGKARRIYQDIVRRLRDPGLLEYVGRDLFRARVFPIPARGDVRIKIVYEEILKYDAGMVEYRHPLHLERGNLNKIGEVAIAVDIESDVAIKSLYSPTHEIDADVRGRKASCGFEAKNASLDRDFVLYYTVSAADVGLNLLTCHPEGEDGYFMALVSPGRLDDSRRVVAKDVVFVVDKSGSMKGEKIAQARGALAYCVNSLNETDRFNIVLFSTNVASYRDELVQATRAEKKKASKFIEGIEARGGTDINEALETALELPESKNPRMVIFLTDGLPTVGETNVESILANLRRKNDQVRIFPFGVGYDVNTLLLDQISIDHRGAVDYIKPEENIEVKISRFHDKVSNPVLADIDLQVDGIETHDVYPRVLPDLFEGTQLVVLGRYRGRGSKSITLTGRIGDRSREFEYEGTFAARGEDFAFIPRLWANRKIAYLLSEIKLHGADKELVDEVIELSLEHGIITPYTSYLILEEGTEADREHLSRATPGGVLPGAPVAGKALASKFLMGRTGARGGELVSGEDAVGLSSDLARERETAVITRGEPDAVRNAGGKRFVRRGDEWVDEEFLDEMDVEKIEFLSDRYFELLDRYPEVKDFLALGEKVTFVLGNVAYRISDE